MEGNYMDNNLKHDELIDNTPEDNTFEIPQDEIDYNDDLILTEDLENTVDLTSIIIDDSNE